MYSVSKYYLLLIFLILATSSCETEIEFPESKEQSRLVVNSVFSPELPWSVEVSHTYKIVQNSKTDNIVRDANVNICEYNNNVLIDTYDLHFKNGVYISLDNKVPHAGNLYEIKVSNRKYPAVKASSICTYPVVINRKSYKDEYKDEEKLLSVDAEVQVQLSKGSRIFTMVVLVDSIDVINRVQTVRSIPDLILTGFSEYSDYSVFVDASTDAATIQWSNDINLSDDINDLVKDYHFPTGIEVGEEDVPNRGDIDDNKRNAKKYISIIYLLNLSSELYNYGISIQDYTDSKGNPITEKDRPTLYSNVTDGYGLFASISEKIVIE